MEAYDSINSVGLVEVPAPLMSWVLPLPGWTKINYDASLVLGQPGVGIGCCCRDNSGSLLIPFSLFKYEFSLVLLAELTVITFGLSLAVERDFCRVVLKSDSKNAIDLILEYGNCLNDFGFVLDDIKELSRRLEVLFSFIPQVNNGVAHRLAHYAFNSLSSKSRVSLFPEWIVHCGNCIH